MAVFTALGNVFLYPLHSRLELAHMRVFLAAQSLLPSPALSLSARSRPGWLWTCVSQGQP
jgi:hypothetical protein